ncbi:MAG: alpha/beta hydrolase [Burkholderiales bacterium]|nr:alpha/beta hydrolase [Burkholderiales bacterium]
MNIVSFTLSTFALTACMSGFALEGASTAYAAAPSISAPSKISQLQVGSMYVEKHANPNAKGAPVIFIPGLSSGGYVWDEAVKRLSQDHELYVVTLAGFHGRPAIAGPKLTTAKESLLKLIQDEHINKPVLVGHSLGSALSIWFAESHSHLIRGVFGVDGLPVLPGTENMSQEQRDAMAEGGRAHFANADQASFGAQQLQYMRYIGVMDDKVAEKLGAESAKSHPASVGDYMAELLKMDMRKDLPAISVPVALVSPYNAPDFVRANMSADAKHAYYRTLMQGTPQLSIIPINDSRHFPMYDQPTQFHDELARFINAL